MYMYLGTLSTCNHPWSVRALWSFVACTLRSLSQGRRAGIAASLAGWLAFGRCDS